MEQIKFKTKIKNGSIRLPSKYKTLENTEVNVAITSEQTETKRKIREVKQVAQTISQSRTLEDVPPMRLLKKLDLLLMEVNMGIAQNL